MRKKHKIRVQLDIELIGIEQPELAQMANASVQVQQRDCRHLRCTSDRLRGKANIELEPTPFGFCFSFSLRILIEFN